LDGSDIRAAALQTSGTAGPPGIDAHDWRRFFHPFALLLIALLPTTLHQPVEISDYQEQLVGKDHGKGK